MINVLVSPKNFETFLCDLEQNLQYKNYSPIRVRFMGAFITLFSFALISSFRVSLLPQSPQFLVTSAPVKDRSCFNWAHFRVYTSKYALHVYFYHIYKFYSHF